MTCRGYDPKAVKISKEVKRGAAQIMDPHVRGAFIRSFVQINEAESRQRSNRNRGEKK